MRWFEISQPIHRVYSPIKPRVKLASPWLKRLGTWLEIQKAVSALARNRDAIIQERSVMYLHSWEFARFENVILLEMLPAWTESNRHHTNKRRTSSKIEPCTQKSGPTGPLPVEKVGSPAWWSKKLGLPPNGPKTEHQLHRWVCSVLGT